MTGKLRNMTSIYLLKDDKVLLLFRKGGRVVSDVWTGSAGGHFEEFELNDAKACVLREMNEELGLREDNIRNLSLRYVTLRRTKGEIRQNYYFFAMLKDGVRDDDTILIELTEDCPIDYANDIFNALNGATLKPLFL